MGGDGRLPKRRSETKVMAAKSSKQPLWFFAASEPTAVQADPLKGEFFIGSSDNELDDVLVASPIRESVPMITISGRAWRRPSM